MVGKKYWLLAVIGISFLIRLVGLNQMGRTWDEYAYVGFGDEYLQRLKNGDFKSEKWYEFPDHPPLTRYIYGMVGQLSIIGRGENNQAIFVYDWTAPRLLSALMSSLTAGLVLLIGWELMTFKIGLIGAGIYSLLPLSVAYGQLVTIESATLLSFTAAVYYFLKFLQERKDKWIWLGGIVSGLAISLKYTNVLLLPLMLVIYVIWLVKEDEGKRGKRGDLKLWLIPLMAGLIFIGLWPAFWFHAKETLVNIVELGGARKPPIERFWGELTRVPKTYFFIYLLITTPVLILGEMFHGLWLGLKKGRKMSWVLLAWLLIPFGQSFYPLRQNGIRYIIQIYVPLSLLAAMGVSWLEEKWQYAVWIVGASLAWALLSTYPYYLDYFNILVGGPKKVYEKKLFNLGWWGEGQREAVLYIASQARAKDVVGLLVKPLYVAPPVQGLYTAKFDENLDFDWVVVSSFYEMTEGFDKQRLEGKYELDYQVKVGGAPLVEVYKHRRKPP